MAWAHSETVDTTQKQLESWLPKEYWGDVNILLASLAQIFLETHGVYRGILVDYSLELNLSTDTIQILSWVYNPKNNPKNKVL
jgi:hypothetical protein